MLLKILSYVLDAIDNNTDDELLHNAHNIRDKPMEIRKNAIILLVTHISSEKDAGDISDHPLLSKHRDTITKIMRIETESYYSSIKCSILKKLDACAMVLLSLTAYSQDRKVMERITNGMNNFIIHECFISMADYDKYEYDVDLLSNMIGIIYDMIDYYNEREKDIVIDI